MDKKFLLRVSDSFKKIKTQLLLNKEIRKLLYYDIIDDDTVEPDIKQVKDNIFLQPVVNVDTVEPFNKKNYITITIPSGEKNKNKMVYVLRIIVMCDKSSWIVKDNIRPILLSQEIINELNGFKTDFSNEIKFSEIVETVTNKDMIGYSILFEAIDGISDIDEK